MLKGEVRAETGGRGGPLTYSEGAGSLVFWWEYSAAGVAIVVPTAAEWDAECRRQGAPWAEGRRAEILAAVADQAPERYAPSARVSHTADSIELIFDARAPG